MIVDHRSSTRIDARIAALAERFRFTVNAGTFAELQAGLLSRSSRIHRPSIQMSLGGYIERRIDELESLILEFYEKERIATVRSRGIAIPKGPALGESARVLETCELLLCEELLFSVLVCRLHDQFADTVRARIAAREIARLDIDVFCSTWELSRLTPDACTWLSFWTTAALRTNLLKVAADRDVQSCQSVLRAAAMRAQGAINGDRMKRRVLPEFVESLAAAETTEIFDLRMEGALDDGDVDLFLTMIGKRLGFPDDVVLLLLFGLSPASLVGLGRTFGISETLTRRVSDVVQSEASGGWMTGSRPSLNRYLGKGEGIKIVEGPNMAAAATDAVNVFGKRGRS